MTLDKFFASQTPRSTRRSTQLSQTTVPGPSQLPMTPVAHRAAIRLGKRAIPSDLPLSAEASPTTSEVEFEHENCFPAPGVAQVRRNALANDRHAKEYPKARDANVGLSFEINWNKLWHGSRRLPGDRVGYRVRSAAQAGGYRKIADIWRYGADLLFIEDDRPKTKKRFWLCKMCHEVGKKEGLLLISGNQHVKGHLLREHNFNVDTGEAIPEKQGEPIEVNPWSLTQLGGAPGISHEPWQGGVLVRALLDWIVVSDVSFRDGASIELRALLAWNRTSVLHGLIDSSTTIATRIRDRFEERKEAIRTVLKSSAGKISLTVDLWQSSNYFSILGVVAHYLG